MLDDLTPRQFAEWIAYRRLEPDAMETVIEVLKLGFAALTNSWGGKVSPDDFDPRDRKEKQAEQTPEQGAMMFRAFAGRVG